MGTRVGGGKGKVKGNGKPKEGKETEKDRGNVCYVRVLILQTEGHYCVL